MTLGQTIRKARQALGVTGQQLAERVRIRPTYLSDIELDRRVPAATVMKALAGALDLELDELRALSGKLGADELRYLKRNPAAVRLVIALVDARLDSRAIDVLRKRVERHR